MMTFGLSVLVGLLTHFVAGWVTGNKEIENSLTMQDKMFTKIEKSARGLSKSVKAIPPYVTAASKESKELSKALERVADTLKNISMDSGIMTGLSNIEEPMRSIIEKELKMRSHNQEMVKSLKVQAKLLRDQASSIEEKNVLTEDWAADTINDIKAMNKELKKSQAHDKSTGLTSPSEKTLEIYQQILNLERALGSLASHRGDQALKDMYEELRVAKLKTKAAESALKVAKKEYDMGDGDSGLGDLTKASNEYKKAVEKELVIEGQIDTVAQSRVTQAIHLTAIKKKAEDTDKKALDAQEKLNKAVEAETAFQIKKAAFKVNAAEKDIQTLNTMSELTAKNAQDLSYSDGRASKEQAALNMKISALQIEAAMLDKKKKADLEILDIAIRSASTESEKAQLVKKRAALEDNYAARSMENASKQADLNKETDDILMREIAHNYELQSIERKRAIDKGMMINEERRLMLESQKYDMAANTLEVKKLRLSKERSVLELKNLKESIKLEEHKLQLQIKTTKDSVVRERLEANLTDIRERGASELRLQSLEVQNINEELRKTEEIANGGILTGLVEGLREYKNEMQSYAQITIGVVDSGMKGVADSFGKTISQLADPRKYQTMEDTFADMFYGLVGQAASAFSEKIMQEGAKYMFDYMGQFSDTFKGMSATVGKTTEELATKANTTSLNMLTSSVNALNTAMAATMPDVASSSLNSAAETAKLANATREGVETTKTAVDVTQTSVQATQALTTIEEATAAKDAAKSATSAGSSITGALGGATTGGAAGEGGMLASLVKSMSTAALIPLATGMLAMLTAILAFTALIATMSVVTAINTTGILLGVFTLISIEAAELIISKVIMLYQAIIAAFAPIPFFNRGGGVKGYAGGGAIDRGWGPAIPRPSYIPSQDTVPAWLSPGEFVIRREAVNKYGARLFAAFNRGLINPSRILGMTSYDLISRESSSMIRGFAGGGSVATPSASEADSEVLSGISVMPVLVADNSSASQIFSGGRDAFDSQVNKTNIQGDPNQTKEWK
jgi:hypothetical protein